MKSLFGTIIYLYLIKFNENILVYFDLLRLFFILI